MDWDSKWSAVSVLATVASLVIPLIIFFTGRDTKELTVETVSRSVLVDLSNPVLSSLRLTYKDVPVDRLTVATIEFRNTGTQPIERADFERPITLRFENALDLLAVTLSEKNPSDLTPVITSDTNGISIAPLLLNPGDQFRITVQIRGVFGEPVVEARILGVPSIARRIYPETNISRRGYIQIGLGIAGFLIYAHVSVFVTIALVRRHPFTALPLPESTVLMFLVSGISILLIQIGLKTLELPTDQIYSWRSLGFIVLAGPVIYSLARRRADHFLNAPYR